MFYGTLLSVCHLVWKPICLSAYMLCNTVNISIFTNSVKWTYLRVSIFDIVFYCHFSQRRYKSCVTLWSIWQIDSMRGYLVLRWFGMIVSFQQGNLGGKINSMKRIGKSYINQTDTLHENQTTQLILQCDRHQLWVIFSWFLSCLRMPALNIYQYYFPGL